MNSVKKPQVSSTEIYYHENDEQLYYNNILSYFGIKFPGVTFKYKLQNKI